MTTGAAGQTLTDVLGAESDPVYRAGQTLTVLESWQLRLPRLRIMVVGGLTPRVLALVGTSVRSTGSAISTSSDVRHVLHLKSLMQRELGAEPLDIAGYAHTDQLFEIRPSAVADLRRATWALAEAADDVVEAFSALQGSRGALGVLTRSMHFRSAPPGWRRYGTNKNAWSAESPAFSGQHSCPRRTVTA